MKKVMSLKLNEIFIRESEIIKKKSSLIPQKKVALQPKIW